MTDDELVALAEAEARAHGVSRVADITGLDRLGVPVWQAVRPWGRSLSVHQGKGTTPAAARIGACLEAVECALAEAWSVPLTRTRWRDLPEAERSHAYDDFATARGLEEPAEGVDWTIAERLDVPGIFHVPAATVSLDLTYAGPAGLERSSNGQGAGLTLEAATLKALGELIERDAYGAWSRRSILDRMDDRIELATAADPEVDAIARRAADLGLKLRAYRMPAIAMPAVAAELAEFDGPMGAAFRSGGSAAHPDARIALRAAVLEAAQARLTEIAGARDDIELGQAADRSDGLGLALPPPPGATALKFSEAFPDGARAVDVSAQLATVVAALAHAGYRPARVVLSPPGAPFFVVRAFAPGLGLLGRVRRPA